MQGKPGIVEGEVAETASLGDLHDTFGRAGIKNEPDMSVFLEEGDEPLKGERHKPLAGLKKGCRLHVSHCAASRPRSISSPRQSTLYFRRGRRSAP